jgi:hypothetical protein
VYNRGWSGLGTRDEAEAAVNVLADYEWLQSCTIETPGRPATVYHVHHAIRENAM